MVNLLKNSEINFQYNFPKKVKKVNLPQAELSNNRQTVSLKINSLEYFKNIEQYNLLIELE